MNLKKLMILVIISACLLISMSCTFAADSNQINGNVTANGQNHEINIDNFNVEEVENNNVDKILVNNDINLKNSIQKDIVDNKQTNSTVPGTYDDLKRDIENLHSGDVYNFTKNYIFDGVNQTLVLENRIIVIDQDNLVINGNGFTIDAGGSQNFAIFKVLSNNVTISNLTFANSVPSCIPGPTIDGHRFERINSPICWSGINGTIKDCNFYNNCAVNGGAMTWTGDNGLIVNCKFINNTARGVGGALYLGGANNTVIQCNFINSCSQLTKEAIYTDRKCEKIRLVNNTFNNNLPFIEGSLFNIDADYLFYSYKIPVWGNLTAEKSNNLDIIPLIYKSIVAGGLNNISNDLNCFAQYFNETGLFILNFAAYEDVYDYIYMDKYSKAMMDFTVDWIESFHLNPISQTISHLGFDYLKSISFSNITDFNQVFDYVLHGNYEVSLTQNLIGFVHDVYDYNDIHSIKGWGYWFDADKGAGKFVNNLKVIFTDKINAESDDTWRPNISGFDSILIMGNGSTIDGYAKDDHDEKKWVEMGGDSNTYFAAYDLTVKNFNTAVECLAGTCYFNNIRFDNNRMDYTIERDWGAAILNTGNVICDNCSFTNNYAKNGAAIFNQGFLSINNCAFEGNKAYGEGDDICVGDGGRVQVGDKYVTSDTKNVYFAESVSMSDMTLMAVVAGVGAFAAGFLTTVFTCNPAIGVAVGGAIGAAFGLFAAERSIECNYDVNFNRITCCGIFVGVGMISGMLGGYFGLYGFNDKIIAYYAELDPECTQTVVGSSVSSEGGHLCI